MTLEEKLAKFSETLAKETQKQSEKAVNDYRHTLETNFERHKEEAFRHSDLQIKHAYNTAKKDKVKFLASAKFNIKKALRKRTNDLKESLYEETLNRLKEYKNSENYLELLKKFISQVEKYAGGKNYGIYVDRSDEKLIEKLKEYTDAPISVSTSSLIGGICGILPENKVILNLSFADRLRDEVEKFDWNEEGWTSEE